MIESLHRTNSDRVPQLFIRTTGIYVQTSFTNLTIAHNQFTKIPGSQSQTAAIVFASGNTGSNTASMLTKTTVSYNQIGG